MTMISLSRWAATAKASVTNMPLDDQWTDQQAVLKAGAVDYVVALTGDLHGDFPQYAVIDRCSYDGGEGEVTWYLYQLQR